MFAGRDADVCSPLHLPTTGGRPRATSTGAAGASPRGLGPRADFAYLKPTANSLSPAHRAHGYAAPGARAAMKIGHTAPRLTVVFVPTNKNAPASLPGRCRSPHGEESGNHPLQNWCIQRTLSLTAASEYLRTWHRFVTPDTGMDSPDKGFTQPVRTAGPGFRRHSCRCRADRCCWSTGCHRPVLAAAQTCG